MKRKSTSFRLSELTVKQLDQLAEKLGLTLTQVIIMAVDRMAREEHIK